MSSKSKTVDELLLDLADTASSLQNSQRYIVNKVDKLDRNIAKIDSVDSRVSVNESKLSAAESKGQIGDAVLKDSVDCNTLTSPENYYCTNCTTALNYPLAVNFFVQVTKNGTKIMQMAYGESDEVIFKRVSTDNGSTWGGWTPNEYSVEVVHIYVSKNGNDNNTGLSENNPVLTVNKALSLAHKVTAVTSETVPNIHFHFGQGDWGSFTITGLSTHIEISDYSDSQLSTDSGVMPYFNVLTVVGIPRLLLSNIEVDGINIVNCYVVLSNYNTLGTVVLNNSADVVFFARQSVTRVKKTASEKAAFIRTFLASSVYLINCTIILDENLSFSRGAFIENDYGEPFIGLATTTVFQGATYSGKKWTTYRNGCIHFYSTYGAFDLNSIPGEQAGTGNYSFNGVPSNCVTLTGDQMIGGEKTFTDTVTNFGHLLRCCRTDNFAKGDTPSSALYSQLVFYARNSNHAISYNSNDLLGCIELIIGTDGNTNLRLRAFKNAANNTDATTVSIIHKKDGTAYTSGPSHLPVADNTYTLGIGSSRWSQLFAGTTTISTSDQRLKDNISNIPDEVLDAWGEVEWSQFQFKDSLKKKGENARLHTGMIAQRIKDIFESRNLDATKYGLLCYDEWDAEDETIIDKEAVVETRTVIDTPAQYDEEGNEISPEVSHTEEVVIEPEVSHVEHKDAGDLYSLRYEECLCMEAAYQRRRAERLENAVASLISRVEKLEKK